MNLYHDPNGPRIDQSALDRLQRLDSGLRLVFSRWALNPETAQPIEFSEPDPTVWDEADLKLLVRRGDSWLVDRPAHYLFALRPDGAAYLVRTYPLSEVPQFGHPQVVDLEADLARRMKPSEIAAYLMRKEEEAMEKAKAEAKFLKADKTAANAKAIFDIATGEVQTTREPKTITYGGQKTHTSSGEGDRRIVLTDKELGIER